jgi:hypothetical protein
MVTFPPTTANGKYNDAVTQASKHSGSLKLRDSTDKLMDISGDALHFHTSLT